MAKEEVNRNLKRLLKRLRVQNVVQRGMIIGRARVPIIKCFTSDGSFALDISMGTANRAAVVPLLRSQIQLTPPLRPLVLVLRSILKVGNKALLCCAVLCFRLD